MPTLNPKLPKPGAQIGLQVGQTKQLRGQTYKLNAQHRWQRVRQAAAGAKKKAQHLAVHEGDELGRGVTSWKMGKVVGGAVGQMAAAAGADPHTANILSETVVQAGTATALYAIQQKRKGKHQSLDTAAYFVSQAAAAYLGKSAHHGADHMLQNMGAEHIHQQVGAIVAGKVTGLGTAVGMMQSGLAHTVVDQIVRRGGHELRWLDMALSGGLRKAAAGLPDQAIALFHDLTQAGIAMAQSHQKTQQLSKTAFTLNGLSYHLVGDRLIKAAKPKPPKPGQMNLFEGQTKEANGKTYELNKNKRWTRKGDGEAAKSKAKRPEGLKREESGVELAEAPNDSKPLVIGSKGDKNPKPGEASAGRTEKISSGEQSRLVADAAEKLGIGGDLMDRVEMLSASGGLARLSDDQHHLLIEQMRGQARPEHLDPLNSGPTDDIDRARSLCEKLGPLVCSDDPIDQSEAFSLEGGLGRLDDDELYTLFDQVHSQIMSNKNLIHSTM